MSCLSRKHIYLFANLQLDITQKSDPFLANGELVLSQKHILGWFHCLCLCPVCYICDVSSFALFFIINTFSNQHSHSCSLKKLQREANRKQFKSPRINSPPSSKHCRLYRHCPSSFYSLCIHEIYLNMRQKGDFV